MVVRSGDDFDGNGWCWISLKSRHYWTDAAALHFITLHYTVLHYITLHYITLLDRCCCWPAGRDPIHISPPDKRPNQGCLGRHHDPNIFIGERGVCSRYKKVRRARKAVVKLEEICGTTTNAII